MIQVGIILGTQVTEPILVAMILATVQKPLKAARRVKVPRLIQMICTTAWEASMVGMVTSIPTPSLNGLQLMGLITKAGILQLGLTPLELHSHQARLPHCLLFQFL